MRNWFSDKCECECDNSNGNVIIGTVLNGKKYINGSVKIEQYNSDMHEIDRKIEALNKHKESAENSINSILGSVHEIDRNQESMASSINTISSSVESLKSSDTETEITVGEISRSVETLNKYKETTENLIKTISNNVSSNTGNITAIQTQIQNLRNIIDGLSGSGTGIIEQLEELIDIRRKADDTTAETAGIAVREQVTELHELIDGLSDTISNLSETLNGLSDTTNILSQTVTGVSGTTETLSQTVTQIVSEQEIQHEAVAAISKTIAANKVKIINKPDVTAPFPVSPNHMEEVRYLDLYIHAPIRITVDTNRPDYYASVIMRRNVGTGGEVITARDIIAELSNVVLTNPDLDVSDFDVIHITLFNDGISICANIGGYASYGSNEI